MSSLILGWMQLVKFHQGTFALAEYAAVVAEQRMARFGRDSAWRTMATLGALDETRHGQIPLLMGHDMLPFDGNFDWTHKAYHTNEWIIIAARHLFDDMFLAARTRWTLPFSSTSCSRPGSRTFSSWLWRPWPTALPTISSRRPWRASRPTRRATGRSATRCSGRCIENGAKEHAQYLVDKMWWRCWRLFLALTGSSMDYHVPLSARRRSYKEFMQEWIIEQFTKNLAEFSLARPWFWDLFIEELDYAQHSFQLGIYAYRTTLWFDVAMPNADERRWLSEKYPDWNKIYAPDLGHARTPMAARR